MNWENSKVITPLKRDFLKAFFEKEQRFFLTGGSALGIFYLEHRFSYDLDFFSTDDFDWKEVDGTIRLASSEIGANLSQVQTAPTFRRYQIVREKEHEIIDFVKELCPQVNPQKEQFGTIRVDTIHEILINKICTLLSRCEIKDLTDLYYLDKKGFHVKDYIEEAKLKDGGLEPAMISMLLSSIQIKDVPDFVLGEITTNDLQNFVNTMRLQLASIAYPGDL